MKTNAVLPKGDENGLYTIAAELIADPKKYRAVIAIVDCRRVTIDQDNGEEAATIRIRRAEVVLPEDLAAAERLIRRALEHRLGQTTLPLDLEDEIEEAFRDMPAELPLDDGGDDPEQDGGGPQ
ncbi:MAG TPA: hypothetical protein VH136_18560 [Trebonia sp.]|nr:hypothetical protein [Trebonia sp.]